MMREVLLLDILKWLKALKNYSIINEILIFSINPNFRLVTLVFNRFLGNANSKTKLKLCFDCKMIVKLFNHNIHFLNWSYQKINLLKAQNQKWNFMNSHFEFFKSKKHLFIFLLYLIKKLKNYSLYPSILSKSFCPIQMY
jgi:hypothetical protein